MSEAQWARQIRSDSSIQQVLCERFVHPTISDCVVVGNCSLRFVTTMGDVLREVARYDVDGRINSAAIVHVDEKPKVCMIWDLKKVAVAVPSVGSFSVEIVAEMDKKFYHVSGGGNIVCLSCFDSSLRFVGLVDGDVFDASVGEDVKVLSTCWVDGSLVVLQKGGNIQVVIYNVVERTLRCVAKHSPNYLKPYRIVGVPHHQAAYILGDGSFLWVRKAKNGAWLFDSHVVPVVSGDSLVVDVAPISVCVHMAILAADGSIWKFDGSKCEFMTTHDHADAIVSVTINRFVLSVENCRLMLLDKSFTQLDEINDVLFNCVSYMSGNFITGARHTIHAIYYDYGIEVEKVATLDFECKCDMHADQDSVFITFPEKTVIVDQQFRDFTPNFLRHKKCDRFHGATPYFFFAVSRDDVSIFDHGSVHTVPLKSTLSVARNSMLYVADEKHISSHLYCHGSLLCQHTVRLNSQVTAIALVLEKSFVVAMVDGSIYLFDDEFNVVAEAHLDYLIVSAAGASSHVVLGTGTGAVLFCDKDLNILSDLQIGIAPVSLNCVNGQIAVSCGDRYHYISPSEGFKTTILPPDFEYFSPIGKGPLVFVALVKGDKGNEHQLMTFKFTNQVQGFHSKRLYDCTCGRIAKITCSKHAGEFLASLVDKCGLSTLFFSKGNVKYPLARGETVVDIAEWRARLKDVKQDKDTHVYFWLVCTNSDDGGKLYFFTQSRSTNEVPLKLKKEFNSPITALTIVSSGLGYFTMAGSILGFSLATGALVQKGKFPVKSNHVIALESSSNCVAVLYDNTRRSQAEEHKKIFSVYQLSDKQSLEHAYTVGDDSILVGCMKIVGTHILVSSRANPVVHIYDLATGHEVHVIRFLAPVIAIFEVKRKAVCCCIDGEMHAVNCDGQQFFPPDVSRMFSFCNFGFSSFV